MQLLCLHRLARLADHGVGGRENGLVRVAIVGRCRQRAAILLRQHRQRTLRQVAEIVGEVGIGAVDDRLVVVVAVLPERHLAQEEIAHLIDAVGVGEGDRIDHIANRLRHFLAAVEQEAVRKNPLRHRDTGRHQERRPVHRVETYDVLADDMQSGRPPALELVAVGIRKSGGGDVVGQRIDPHIHDVLVVAGHADAPVERGARDRQILQAAAHEARDLVQPLLRQHEGRIVLVKVDQLLLVSGEAEEIALLLHPLDRRAGLGGDPDLVLVEMRLVLGVVSLVADRVPAGIFREIDVAVLLHPLPDRPGRTMMTLLGGADEIVVRAIHLRDHRLEAWHVAVEQLLRGHPLFRGGLLDFLAVLVGAGQEEHVVTVEPHEAGDRVGRDHFIGVADVRGAVGVGNGGGDVIRRFC